MQTNDGSGGVAGQADSPDTDKARPGESASERAADVDDKTADDAAEVEAYPDPSVESGGPKGLEPTRYGDWERKGIISDF